MQNIRGYEIRDNSDLAHWASLLEEWMLAIERYCRITEDDAPYWYNERANIGILAGAAWRCGRIALEEFQYEKKKEKQTVEGRADLWIGTEKDEEMIEAKYRELPLQSASPVPIAEKQLDIALKDAEATKGKDDIRAIGVSFLYITVLKKNAKALSNMINQFINEMKETSYGLMAWSFPHEMQEPDSKSIYISPGIIMMARVVK